MVTDDAEKRIAPTQGHLETCIRGILWDLGEDPDRDGLAETPRRVIKALRELTSGYDDDPAKHLSVQFDVTTDAMIVVSDLQFVSLCEHHMLPFTGTAKIGYVPTIGGGKVVGLSKLGRVLDCFAKRLQVQERLTMQIGEAIEEHLNPAGTGVVITAEHSCMSMRGVHKHGNMTTSFLAGVFRDDAKVRNEFLSL